MAFSLLRPPRGIMPSLKLTPSQYGDPNYIFIANTRRNFNLSKQVVEAAVEGPGLGGFRRIGNSTVFLAGTHQTTEHGFFFFFLS